MITLAQQDRTRQPVPAAMLVRAIIDALKEKQAEGQKLLDARENTGKAA